MPGFISTCLEKFALVDPFFPFLIVGIEQMWSNLALLAKRVNIAKKKKKKKEKLLIMHHLRLCPYNVMKLCDQSCDGSNLIGTISDHY